jgi:GNAT superfamily N-acetyltransferase
MPLGRFPADQGTAVAAPSSPSPEVIRLVPARDPHSLDTLVERLCRAFDRDAHINWIVRQDSKRALAFRQFFRLLLTDLLGTQGEVYATTDLQAAAIGFPPHAASLGLPSQARVARRFAEVTGWGNLLTRAYGLNRMETRHPGLPHYFLQTIGVEPDYQGLGYGTALMSTILARCDAEGIPAFLVTSNATNLGFYGRHGFKVISEYSLPHGPKLWRMLRGPL